MTGQKLVTQVLLRKSRQAGSNPTLSAQYSTFFVRMKGLEPPRLSAPDPKSGAAANYATSAHVFFQILSLARLPAGADGLARRQAGLPITPHPQVKWALYQPSPFNSVPKDGRLLQKEGKFRDNSGIKNNF